MIECNCWRVVSIEIRNGKCVLTFEANILVNQLAATFNSCFYLILFDFLIKDTKGTKQKDFRCL